MLEKDKEKKMPDPNTLAGHVYRLLMKHTHNMDFMAQEDGVRATNKGNHSEQC